MRTLTPRRIAFRAGTLSALLSFLLVVILITTKYHLPDGAWLLLLPIITGLTSYWFFYYLMEKFIDQKIKLIYRSIHQEKIGRPLSNMRIDMSKDVFREVNRDVEDWAQDYRKEINLLKEQAEFRREFIGNLAHELKTPITIIQGNILTLLEGAVDDKKIRNKFLEKAADNVERLENLTKDLDHITKLEAGKAFLDITRFDLAALTQHIIDNLLDKAIEKNVTLILDYPKGRELFVDADKARIDQVLTNLIINSINYGVKEGETKVRFTDHGDHVDIEIKDNGIGIEATHLPRLFERFFRVDKSRSRHVGGTGLGLAIVKHILDAHQQTINVRSTVGKGSSFIFTLQKSK